MHMNVLFSNSAEWSNFCCSFECLLLIFYLSFFFFFLFGSYSTQGILSFKEKTRPQYYLTPMCLSCSGEPSTDHKSPDVSHQGWAQHRTRITSLSLLRMHCLPGHEVRTAQTLWRPPWHSSQPSPAFCLHCPHFLGSDKQRNESSKYRAVRVFVEVTEIL